MNGYSVLIELAIDALTILREAMHPPGLTHAQVVKAMSESVVKAQVAIASLGKILEENAAEADRILDAAEVAKKGNGGDGEGSA